MSLKITKASEPLEVSQIVLAIYGQPGAGKTSIAFSASKPLMLDFDGGAYRAAKRGDAVEVAAWSEIANIGDDDIAAYDTIIVDTVGRALDTLTDDIIQGNPKMARGGGALSLQGYGQLKATFTQWIKMLRQRGKDVILIAHDAEDKSGDDLIVRPDVQGGSRQELVKVADSIGYLYRRAKDTVLDFNPTDRWIGKNCAQLDPLIVPNLADKPDFLAGVIAGMKESLNQLSAEQQAVIEEIEGWTEVCEQAEDAEAINSLVEATKDTKPPVKSAAKHKVAARAKALGLTFDKQAKCFVVPQSEETEQTPEESEA